MQQPPQGPWGQPQPPQYAPQAPMMQQPYPPHPGAPPPMQAMAAPGKAANPALLVLGALLLFVGLGAGAVFLYNVYQYMTVADHFADLPPAARDFGVRLVQGAAVKRMVVFGPVGGLFGVGGLVMLFLGRKK